MRATRLAPGGEACSHIFPRTCLRQKMTSCQDAWKNKASNTVWSLVTDKVVRMHPVWCQLCESWVSNLNQSSELFLQLIEREVPQRETHFWIGWTAFPRKLSCSINWFNWDFWQFAVKPWTAACRSSAPSAVGRSLHRPARLLGSGLTQWQPGSSSHWGSHRCKLLYIGHFPELHLNIWKWYSAILNICNFADR